MSGSLAVVLGIRPDVIRASILLELLSRSPDCELSFIWSGQHYSDNLKDVFFRELEVPRPDVELGAGGETDAEIVASVISRLHPVLDDLRPDAVLFLGDTNTVMGAIAAAQLGLPIVHVEGCMRSYDWRMPEEKYRTVVDHLSDVIYAYTEGYKQNGVREGLSPDRIVVTGNPIVDVLDKYYFGREPEFRRLSTPAFFEDRGIERDDYFLMTCHRRENVHDERSLTNILSLVAAAGRRVYFPASYRTQRILEEGGWEVPENVIMVDPVGYREMLVLMVNAYGIITDSGTVVEEACVLGVPCVQTRRSTERPEVYDVGACVKFDPTGGGGSSLDEVLAKVDSLRSREWSHTLGDGDASRRIVDDLTRRLASDRIATHDPDEYPFDVTRSYRDDGL